MHATVGLLHTKHTRIDNMDNTNKNQIKCKGIKVYLIVFISALCIHNETQAQNKQALLVGISNYPTHMQEESSWKSIHGANDVNTIAPILKKQGFSVKLLSNQQATHSAILKNLSDIIRKVKSGDIVYLHFSGHGQAVEDLDGDEPDGWDEAFIPYDAQKKYNEGIYTGEKHLLDDELNKHLSSLRTKLGPTGILYVVMDACHAGSTYRGDDVEDSTFVRGTDLGFSRSGKTYAPRIDKRSNISLTSLPNAAPIYMVEACRAYEVNTEIKENDCYYGPLSYYIIQELLTTPLSFDTKWIEQVRKNMDKDIRLIRQHLVLESSQ